jgi:hypothetical protein
MSLKNGLRGLDVGLEVGALPEALQMPLGRVRRLGESDPRVRKTGPGPQRRPQRLRRRLVPERVDRDRHLLMDFRADERRLRVRGLNGIADRLHLVS